MKRLVSSFFVVIFGVFLYSFVVCDGQASALHVEGYPGYNILCSEGTSEWYCWFNIYPRPGEGGTVPEVAILGGDDYSTMNGDSLCFNWYWTRSSAEKKREDSYNVDSCDGDYNLGYYRWLSSDPSRVLNPDYRGWNLKFSELKNPTRYNAVEPFTVRYDDAVVTVGGGKKEYKTSVCIYGISYWTTQGKYSDIHKYCQDLYHNEYTQSFEGDSGVLEITDEGSDAGTRWDEAPGEFVGWTGSGNAKKTYIKENCDINDGCWVSFRHYLRRTSDGGETRYMIERFVDGVSQTKFDGWQFKEDFSDAFVARHPAKIYPGQEMCEKMTFYADGMAWTKKASTEICAVASDKVGSDIGIVINERPGVRSVYTKPGDEVRLLGTYDPWYQSMYNTELSSGSTINGNVVNGNTTVGGAFNSIMSPSWKNAFSIKLGDDCGSTISGSVGSADRLMGRRVYEISSNDVGTKKEAVSITNCNSNSRTTPNWVSLSNDNGKIAATVNTDPKSSEKVEIYTPYNFINTASMTRANSYLDTVAAGSTTKLGYDVTVNPKTNKLVTGSDTEKYATIVKNGKVKPKICYDGPNGDDCDEGAESGLEDLNSSSNAEGATVPGVMSVDIPDIPAGKAICIAPLVYPATSGADNNLDEKGDNLWTEPGDEDFRCFTVRKTPNFQVWGGNVEANSISAWSATKKINDEMRLFGSWGELAVSTPSGENQTMASGAAWGYVSNNDGVLQPNPYITDNDSDPGGGSGNQKCDYSKLTFGSGCGVLGSIGGGSGEMNESTIAAMAGQIKEKLEKADKYFYSNTPNIGLGEEELVNNKRFYENTGNISILTDIRIDRSNSDNNFSKLDDVPQVVVYAENIDIACDVKRIDAILIASGNINTCSDKKNKDDLRNYGGAQTQLIINGAMYANGNIYFYRTYGAGTGANSIVPAEIVNYDNSMLFTGGGSNGTPTGGSMDVVYVRELAPRY